MKYSEELLDFLKEEKGYTHCFFVAGGNIMHLLDAARTRFECIPVVHEVAAGIAVEYFNETNLEHKKAFALVTAGPGLTNIVTAIAGAYLESRELLVIGGQVKTSDLKSPSMRQRGIQEIDGRAIVEPITNHSVLLKNPMNMSEMDKLLSGEGRPGPIFIEIPLDVQAALVDHKVYETKTESEVRDNATEQQFITEIKTLLETCERPIILIGGGLSRDTAWKYSRQLSELGIPVMTTWNGSDRYGSDLPNYWGRPNTWGQRSANILLQQSDLVIAVGTRLGIQQTGFAWDEFCPLAKIFQIDIDQKELDKGHPKIFRGLCSDASGFLVNLIGSVVVANNRFKPWLEFGTKVIEAFPLNDFANANSGEYVDPFELVIELGSMLTQDDAIVPCSSGGAFTVTLQALSVKHGQTITSDKGLASMGYGLSGAIGAALSTQRRTILIEGDGGFSQNLQELGTVAQQNLNLKIFIFSNSGYASIRMTQRNYFNGAYLGCDTETGLGMPDLQFIAKAYGIPFSVLKGTDNLDQNLASILSRTGPELIEVLIDPEQTYWPKITSRILPDGKMVSNPLHLMTPDLSPDQITEYLPYLASRLNK